MVSCLIGSLIFGGLLIAGLVNKDPGIAMSSGIGLVYFLLAGLIGTTYVWGNRSRGLLTAVDHTEHGFAGKLKAIGRGIAGILQLFGDRQRLPLPEPQDSRCQDRCNVNKSLLVGRARSFNAVGHGQNLRKRMATDRGDRWAGLWPSAASIVYLPGGGASWRKKAQILARCVDDAREKRPPGAFASVIQPTY